MKTLYLLFPIFLGLTNNLPEIEKKEFKANQDNSGAIPQKNQLVLEYAGKVWTYNITNL